jgi:NADPH2:quinone reductase
VNAAILHQCRTPIFGDFNEPAAQDGDCAVAVHAAAISRFDIMYVGGTHYLKPHIFPCVSGGEGVGHLEDGRRVYFGQPVPPFGSMARKALVRSEGLITVPEGVDDGVAAVLGNSGLAAWLPLSWRAQLSQGGSVLILGAGIVGRLAVQAAIFNPSMRRAHWERMPPSACCQTKILSCR